MNRDREAKFVPHLAEHGGWYVRMRTGPGEFTIVWADGGASKWRAGRELRRIRKEMAAAYYAAKGRSL